MSSALMVLAAYLAGGIPFGLIVSYALTGEDPRKVGSGNIGATNVSRAAGKKAGAITLVLDALKGFVPVLIAQRLFPNSPSTVAMVGMAALCGHCFSPYLRLKGGKGVATGAGVFLAINPLALLLSLAVFAGMLKWKGYVALSSMSAAWAMPFFILILKGSPVFSLMAAAMAAIITLRHRSNIERLLAGEEPVFGKKGESGN
jgi:glycerol-3-phosphate acyltransferase PlsY